MKAIILAAGKGERLGKITKNIPKPMLRVKGKIILERNIQWLKKYGVKDIYINLHYLPNIIRGYFKDGRSLGVKIHYSYENKILGTAGAVRNIIKSNPGNWRGESLFLVIYGDNLYTREYNIKNMLSFHSMKKGIATIGLYRKVSEFKKSGIAILDKNKMITSFVEKPSSIVKIKHGLVNTGVYAFNLDILKYIPLGYSDFGRDVFPKLLEKRLSVYGFVFKNGLIAIDTPELYRKAVN